VNHPHREAGPMPGPVLGVGQPLVGVLQVAFETVPAGEPVLTALATGVEAAVAPSRSLGIIRLTHPSVDRLFVALNQVHVQSHL